MRLHNAPVSKVSLSGKGQYQRPNQDNDSSEGPIRNFFIGKIMTVLTCSQIMTSLSCFLTGLSPATRQFFHDNPWIGWLALLASTFGTILFDVVPSIRSRPWYNIVILCILTVTHSVIMAMISTITNSNVPLLMMIATTMTSACVAAAGLCGRINVTVWFVHAIVCIYISCMIQIGMIFVCPHICPNVGLYDKVVGTIAALLYCAYNGAVVQMINEQVDIRKPDEIGDVIGNVLLLYPDIINVLKNVLRMVVGTAARKEIRQRSAMATTTVD